MMDCKDFVKKICDVTELKTLYVLGAFGAPMTAANKARYKREHSYNRNRSSIIDAATEKTFGFDCIGLIKGILWGFQGDSGKTYGGARYASNSVSDVNADGCIKMCAKVSKDFSDIIPGEVVHLPGHIGVYVGAGLVVECTPKWKNSVQYSAIMDGKGYPVRKWDTHGRLPWVDYHEGDSYVSLADRIIKGDPAAHVTRQEMADAFRAAGIV